VTVTALDTFLANRTRAWSRQRERIQRCWSLRHKVATPSASDERCARTSTTRRLWRSRRSVCRQPNRGNSRLREEHCA